MPNKLLSEDDFQEILKARFKMPSIKFSKAEWKPLSENVEGLMGEHHILKIFYKMHTKEDAESFFVKSKPKSAPQKAVDRELNCYGKEIFFYDYLLKEFEKMGYYISFAPKAYYHKDNSTIVMEDLTVKGFKLSGKTNFYDLDHCKAALRSLAYLHAAGFAYEETISKEMGRTYKLKEEFPDMLEEVLFVPGDVDGVGMAYIESTKDCLRNLIKYIPESGGWRSSFETRLAQFDFAKEFCKFLPYRQTLVHGDLWCNNMLFKDTRDTPTHCCLVDFQVLRQYHPAYDAMALVYSNTRRSFRQIYFDQLLDYYYNSLEEILSDYGFEAKDILPRIDFLDSVEALKHVALMQAIAGRTFTFLPQEVTNTAMKSEEGFDILLNKDRPKLVEEGFKKDNIFKSILLDDMYDLYEHIRHVKFD